MAQSTDAPATLPISNDTQKIVETILELGGQLSLPNVSREWIIFDGTSGDCFRQWLDQLETIHLEAKGNHEITLRAASRLLKGSAQEYFLRIASQLNTWDQFKIMMLDQYNHLTDSMSARFQLAKLYQKPKESLPQYYEKYKALANQAYVGIQHETLAKDNMIQGFIQGISDTYTKRYVRERIPRSLDEAYKLANEGQKVNAQMGNDRHRNDPEPMDCDAVATQAAAAQTAAAQTSAVQEVKQELSRLKNVLELLVSKERDHFQVEPQHAPHQRLENPYQQPPYQQPRNQNFRAQDRYPAPGYRTQFHPGPPRPAQERVPVQPPPQYRWTPDNRPICAYCGYAGHTQRVCRKKAAANPNNQPSGPQGPQQGPGRQSQNRQQKKGNF